MEQMEQFYHTIAQIIRDYLYLFQNNGTLWHIKWNR